MPVRHDLEGFIADYIAAADATPLFRSAIRKTKRLSDAAMTGNDILCMVKRRYAAARLRRDCPPGSGKRAESWIVRRYRQ